MIVGWTGLPGASKTTSLARASIGVLYRNKRFYERTGRLRELWSNISFAPSVAEEFPEQIRYWNDLEQLTVLRDVDVVIDEAMVYFDSRSWEHLSLDVRRWLAQHRKFGIEIYFTAQEFSQVDIAFRRLVSNLFYLTKLVGSRDISPTLPPIRFIWGIIVSQTIDPIAYEENNKTIIGMPTFRVLSKADTLVFDTREEVKGSKYPPLKHIERNCTDEACYFKKTVHV